MPDDPEEDEKLLAAQTKRFMCKLHVAEKDDDYVETVPYSITITNPRRPPSYCKPVPYHKEEEPPDGATAYLQLWEMDLFKTDKYLTNEETDTNARANRLVATIPGYVVRVDTKYEFRATGDVSPTRTADELKGMVTLKLKDADGDEQEFECHLPEYEGVLEFAAFLAKASGESALSAVDNYSGICSVHNVETSARRQVIERGGIAMAFASDYGDSSNNDKEFARQATNMLATMPTFAVEDGELRFGFHKISGYSEMTAKMQEVRNKVKGALELSKAPKITTLLLYAHGSRTKIQLNPGGYNASGSLRPDRCEEFVSNIKPHVDDHLVIALFACNNGRGPRAGGNGGTKDATYGKALPCEFPGFDSLGWSLHRELVKQGLENNTVWGHTTSGHTTRNSKLRAFSSWGVADFISIVFGARAVTSGTYMHYTTRFGYSFAKQALAEAKAKLSNANKIRAMSCQSAMYLPWAWNGGTDATAETPGYNPHYAREVQSIFDSIKGLMGKDDVVGEVFSYASPKKLYIAGLAEGAPRNPQLSEHFWWSEVKEHIKGQKLSVRLLKLLEVVRCRSKKSMSPKKIFEGGDGVAVSVHANHRDKVVEEAQKLVDEGLLTGAWLDESPPLIHLSQSGLTYSGDHVYVTGCNRPAEEQAWLTRDIPYPPCGEDPAMTVNRQLAERIQGVMDSVEQTLVVKDVKDGGDTFVLASTDDAVVEAAGTLAACGFIGKGELGDGGTVLSMNPPENQSTSSDDDAQSEETEDEGGTPDAAPLPVKPSSSMGSSVGQGGRNTPGDVALIQQKLQGLGYPVADISGVADGATVRAIKHFQGQMRDVDYYIRKDMSFPLPDGRVDRGGTTQKRLFGGSPASYKAVTPSGVKPKSADAQAAISGAEGGEKGMWEDIEEMWETVSPYLPAGSELTKGYRHSGAIAFEIGGMADADQIKGLLWFQAENDNTIRSIRALANDSVRCNFVPLPNPVPVDEEPEG